MTALASYWFLGATQGAACHLYKVLSSLALWFVKDNLLAWNFACPLSYFGRDAGPVYCDMLGLQWWAYQAGPFLWWPPGCQGFVCHTFSWLLKIPGRFTSSGGWVVLGHGIELMCCWFCGSVSLFLMHFVLKLTVGSQDWPKSSLPIPSPYPVICQPPVLSLPSLIKGDGDGAGSSMKKRGVMG